MKIVVGSFSEETQDKLQGIFENEKMEAEEGKLQAHLQVAPGSNVCREASGSMAILLKGESSPSKRSSRSRSSSSTSSSESSSSGSAQSSHSSGSWRGCARRAHGRSTSSSSSCSSRSRSRPRCHRDASRSRCNRWRHRSPPRRYRAKSRSYSRSPSPARQHQRRYRSRSRGRRLYGFVGRSRFISSPYRSRTRSRSRSRSPHRTSVHLSLDEKRELLRIAQANAAKVLGVEDLELPKSVSSLLEVPEELSRKERVRPEGATLKSLLEQRNPVEADEVPSPKTSPKNKVITFSIHNTVAKPTAGRLPSSPERPQTMGLDSTTLKNPYGHWVPVKSQASTHKNPERFPDEEPVVLQTDWFACEYCPYLCK